MRGKMTRKRTHRQKVLEHWYLVQGVLFFSFVMSIALPLMWGLHAPVSEGGIGWFGVAKIVALMNAFGAIFGEIGRRLLNREHYKNLCKWVWQK